ncbi:MAG: hypothetical protein ABIU11_05725 [Chitinophagaceae bacterium]
MRKSIFCFFITILCSLTVFSQPAIRTTDKLKVFIDCSSTWCDMSFIRTEINLVDFMLDRIAADVHVLVTEQNTGSGGSKYQLIFFGQNNFKSLQDTLSFNTGGNATQFEKRDALIKYLKLGLIPFISKTAVAKDVDISLKQTIVQSDKKDDGNTTAKDPWNYWVFRLGTNGNINADEVYKSFRYSGNFSANRTTEDLKVGISGSASKNKSTFEYETTSGFEKFTVNNHNFDFSHFLVKSINSHWSYGYEFKYNQSTFSNNKGRAYFKTAVEYDIFPYKEVNNKLFTISYGINVRNNKYYDTTIYEKLHETLLGHGIEAAISFNQKWGSTSVGINYHNYLHNWKFFNVGVNAYTNVRITGGLSFYIALFGGLTRDQIFLPKGGASPQEVLTRRRQLASGYNYYTSFGITYRFGSNLNNFVNPRFEGNNNNNFYN